MTTDTDPHTDVTDAIITFLQRVREKQGLNRAQAADLAGVSPQTPKNIERGVNRPKLETLQQFAEDAYGIKVDVRETARTLTIKFTAPSKP